MKTYCFCFLGLLVFASDVFAQSWETVRHFPEGPVVSMHFLGENIGFIGTGSVYKIPAVGVIYRTTDKGKTWSLCETPGASIGNVGGVFDIQMVDARHGWAAVWDEDASLWRTDDSGHTWTPVGCDGKHGCGIRVTPTALVKTDLLVAPQRSLDGGLTFSAIDVNTPNDGTLGIDFTDDLHGVMTRYRNGGSWERTTDGGVSWMTTTESVEAWSVYAVPGTTIFYTCEEGNSYIASSLRFSKIKRSEDNGATWSVVAELPFLSTGHITGIGEELFIQTDEARSSATGIYRSQDRGVSWQSIGGPRTTADGRFTAFSSGCNSITVFAGDPFGNVFRWTSGGGESSGNLYPKFFGTIPKAKGALAEVPVASFISSSLQLDSMLFVEAAYTLAFDSNFLSFDISNPQAFFTPPKNWVIKSIGWTEGGLRIHIANFLGASLPSSLQELGTISLLVTSKASKFATISLKSLSLSTKTDSYSFCDNIESGPIGRIQIVDASIAQGSPLSTFFFIAPNPASEKVKVQWSNADTPGSWIEIISVRGMRVFESPIPYGSTELEISTSTLPTGSYIVRFHNKGEIVAVGRFEIVQ